MSSSADRLMRLGVLGVAVFAVALMADLLPQPTSASTDGSGASATSTPPVLPDPEATSTPPVLPDPEATSTPPVQPETPATSTPPVLPDPEATSTPPVQPEPPATSTPPVQPETPATSTPPVQPDPPATSTPPVQPDPPATSTPPVQPDPPATSTPPVQPDPPATSTPPLLFAQGIAAQSYTAGQPVSVTLPSASGGAAPLSYRLDPDLPDGLSFDPGALVISGSPTGFSPPTLYQLTVTDADGDWLFLQFLIGVDEAAIQQSAATVTGVAITSTARIWQGSPAPYAAAANIDVDVTFSGPVTVTGSPRLALSIGSRTRQAAYRSAASSTVSFRYAVVGADRDADGIGIAADALTLNGGTIRSGGVDVNLGLGSHALGAQADHQVDGGGASFDGVASPSYTFEMGTSTVVTLPAAADAAELCELDQSTTPPTMRCTPAYTLAPTPSLPSGLTFYPTFRTIEGAPSAVTATTTYTLIANSPGGSDTLPFTIRVLSPPPSVSGVSITSVPAGASNYAAGENIDVDVTFSGAVSVTGTPRLALGIGANTRQAAFRSASGSTLSFRYRVTADDADVDGISIAADALTLNGGAITEAPGGRAALLGLGTHAVSNSASHKVNDASPSFGSTTIEDLTAEKSGAITPVVLPTAAGGDGSLAYTLTPSTLPTGMTWTASTRTIAGTPAAATTTAPYTWTATDADGDSASLTFRILVTAPAGPAPDDLTLGSTMTNYVTGDTLTVTVRYPRKMSVNTNAGTPSLNLVIGDKTRRALYNTDASDSKNENAGNLNPYGYLIFQYVVRMEDFDDDGVAIPADALRLNGGRIRTLVAPVDAKLHLGSHAVVSGDSKSVKMKVNDVPPTFGSASIASRVYDLNASTTPFVLPEAGGGGGMLTYTLTPTTMPAGMTWTASTRTIAGTPTATTTAVTYTWKATDGGGDSASLTFSIEVRNPTGPAVSGVVRYLVQSEHQDDTDKDNYTLGETLRVALNYRPTSVTVTGSPQLVLIIGDKRVKANYDALHSWSRGVVFSHQITSEDWDGDGITIPPDAVLLNGGSIRVRGGPQDGQDVKLNLGSHAIVSGSIESSRMRVRDTVPYIDHTYVTNVRVPVNKPVELALVGQVYGDAPFVFTVSPALPEGLYIGTPDAESTLSPNTPCLMGQTSEIVTNKRFWLRALDRDGDETLLSFFLLTTGDSAAVDEVEILSGPYANDTYGAGEVIEVAVGFDRSITGTSLSQSTLTIDVGANTRNAAYHGTDADGRLVYKYTVQPGRDLSGFVYEGGRLFYKTIIFPADGDADGITVSADALKLNGAAISDASTQVAASLDLGTHAVSNDSSHKVDGSVATPMAVETVAITSSPASADGYDVGEVIEARVTFSKPATVTGAPQLALTVGATNRQASYQAAKSGGDHLVFTHTVTTQDKDADGISITDTLDSEGNVTAHALTLNGGTISDSGGTAAPRALGTRAIANASAHKVYTPPRVTRVSILSGPGVNGTYDAGETIELQLTFSETTLTHGVPQVALTIGANTRQAVWTSDVTGLGRTHLYRYLVTADDEDTDGIGIGADALTLPPGASIRATFGREDAELSLGSRAVENDSAHTVRDYPPMLGSIQAQNYVMGTAVDFALPQATGGNGLLTYSLSPAALPAGLTLATSSTATSTITGTPTATTTLTAYTWSVTDVDGDTAQSAFSIAVAASNAPMITDVRFYSSPRAGSGSGNTYDADTRRPIVVHVEFDREVIVNYPRDGTGGPQLALEIGTKTVQVDLSPGGGYAVSCVVGGERRVGNSRRIDAVCTPERTTLQFIYNVQGTDEDQDGISIPEGALTLDRVTLRDRATNSIDASLSLGSHAITNDPGHKVDGGSNVPPVVAALDVTGPQATPPADGYQEGDTLSIHLTFDEHVTLTGSPSIALQVGSQTRQAAFHSVVRPDGAAPNAPYSTLKFTYTFLTTDSDSDGISIADTLDSDGNVTAHAVRLNGATIRDSGGRDAVLDLGTQAIVDDADFRVLAPPKITSVSVISPAQQSGTYTWPHLMTIAIDYNQPVMFRPPTATSTAGMRLTVGIASGDQVFLPSNSQTMNNRIAFTHNVMPNDVDTDGVSLAADALDLMGGTLRDAEGEDAQTDLTGFTFTNKPDAKIDGTKANFWPEFATTTLTVSNPAVDTPAAVNLPRPGGDEPLSWSVSPALPAGLSMNAVTGAISGTPTLETPLKQYTVTVQDHLGVPPGGQGYYTVGNGDTATTTFQMRVTGPRPAVTGVNFVGAPQAGDTYGAGEEVVVGVSFDSDAAGNIIVRETPQLALKIGNNTRQAVYYYTAQGTRTLHFRYTVQASDLDADGVSIEAGALTLGSGAAIRRVGGHDAVTDLGVHTVADSPSHKVNGASSVTPTVTGVRVVSQPARGTAYNLGEEIEVEVEFNRAVAVTGSPTLGLTVGTATRQASYGQAGVSPRYHYFRYLVQATDASLDGLRTTVNALTVPSGSHIRNAAGANAQQGILGTAQSISSSNVNGYSNRAAYIRDVRISSIPAEGTTYKLGETITVQVRYSKPVTVTGAPRLGIMMTSGMGSGGALYARSVRAQETPGPSQPHHFWLEFDYTVQSYPNIADDYDPDGITVNEINVAVRNEWVLVLMPSDATIVGAADGGVTAELRSRVTERVWDGIRWVDRTMNHSLVNQAQHKVDGRQPRVTSLEIHGQPANLTRCNDPDQPPSPTVRYICSLTPGALDAPSYFAGETINALVTFSGPVRVSSASVPLTLANGTVTASSWSYYQPTSNNYAKVLIGYTVQASDQDPNGIGVSRNSLSGDVGSRAVGNPAVLTHAAVPENLRHAILKRAQAPALIRYATVQSQPNAAGGYDADEYIRVGVVFDEQVNVAGSPRLSLQIGGSVRTASYVGSNGTILSFRYLVQAGDLDVDGISLPANAMSLNGARITTRRNNVAANIGNGATTPFADHKVDGAQNRPPNVTGAAITSTPLAGAYGAGEAIYVELSFHKRMAVTGSPQLTITLDGATTTAAYHRTDDRSITFRYQVRTGDTDTNGVSVGAGALNLNGGTIQSHSGVNANLGLGSHAITDAAGHRVDGHVITVPTFAADAVADKDWYVNRAVSHTLPEAVGGRGGLTYSLTPALPAGMSFDNTTRTISGTARTLAARTSYTLTARDPHGVRGSVSFDITIGQSAVPTFGSQTVADQTWLRAGPITEFTLPTATSGDGALTYTIIPPFQRGVTIATSTPYTVSGAPAGARARTMYTWTATDSDGETASVTFHVATDHAGVNLPFFGTKTIADQSWLQNKQVLPTQPEDWQVPNPEIFSGNTWYNTRIFLPTVEGPGFDSGDPDRYYDSKVQYTLSPALPAGLTLATTTRRHLRNLPEIGAGQISGTPTEAMARTLYTWTAAAPDADSAVLSFYITVAPDLMPYFSGLIENKRWVRGKQIPGFTLPEANSGDGALTYALTPALPAGVTMDAATRAVSGTPTAAATSTLYTWTATDADGDTGSLTFDIAVGVPPSFGSQTIANKDWAQNLPIPPFDLPAATGGYGTLTYALSPALPDGVTRSATSTFAVSGTPTPAMSSTQYTWTVTDEYGDSASLRFSVSVDSKPTFGGQTIPEQFWTQNVDVTPFTLPRAAGGNGTLTYMMEPGLPPGMDISDSLRVTGASPFYQSKTRFAWTVTDEDGDMARIRFFVTIYEDVEPTFGSQTIADQTWTQRQPITAFDLPTATSGNGGLTYTLSPALPAGVATSTTSATSTEFAVSGTPTGHQTAVTYTWTATDADGDSAELTFTITIAEDLFPTFGAAAVANQSWTQRQAITAFDLPTASGGDAPLTYTLGPALPAGVTRATTTPYRVSGTPSGYQGAASYTWKVTDADGDTAQLTFTITIAEDLAPTFGSATIADRTWTQRQAVTAFTLPTAAGGDAPLTYTLSPALPNGVTKNAGHRVSGAPTVKQAATEYTWTVEDADGDTASLTFNIAVDGVPSFSATISDKSWTQRQAITAFTLPTASGGDGSLTYTLSPALPDGLTRATTTPYRVTGAPTVKQASTEYTWTATDTDGDTASLTFDIAVDGVPTFGSAAISDQSWTQRQAITAFTLPTASGGDGSLTYTLSPALPNGVTLNLTTREVSGAPTVKLAGTEYTWTARDTDGDTASLTFDIAVDGIPSFSATIPNQTWTQNKAITAFTLPLATGGDGNLTHTLSPALPAGVTKNAGHRISGTPTGHQAAATYTWKVTDADGDAAELTFTIAIAEDLFPTFGSQTIAAQSWKQYDRITAFTLPTATGGDAPLSYTIRPALPAGVTKNASHEISGTPTVKLATTTYTWVVRDADGDTARLTFTIAIDGVPAFYSIAVGDQSWTQRQPISEVVLPGAHGGDGELTYTLSPALPSGATSTPPRAALMGILPEAEKTIIGTPTVSMARTQYTWKVEDTDGDAASLTFYVSVDGIPTFGSTTIANQSWTQRQQITGFALPTVNGGDTPVTYTISPALPAGVSKNANHEVSGTPTGHQTATTYTWKATDADGDAVQLTFKITIAEDLAPSFGSATISDKSWTQRQAITAFTLPTASGGDGSLTYTLSPALPAGVATTTTFAVSGTPSGKLTSTTYTWTATDTDGDTASLTFDIGVDGVPTFGSATIADQSWTQRQAITSFTLPTASGGDGSLTYTLSPSLPNGVTKNASHEISGTPSVKQVSTEYTWTAEDSDGDTASLTFDIAVDGVPSFGSTTISDKSWTQRQAITAFTLPTASGGDGSLTYTLSPSLPNGVSKNASHRISGTPSVKQASTEYTWTARDTDGDTASLTFDIGVDGVPSFSATIPDKSWTQRQAITAFTLPTASGGDGSLSYTLSPALPNGVTLNLTTRQVSGTPSVKQASTEYTWTARDTDGDTASLTFDIAVDGIPSFSATIANQTWTQNQAITAFTLPLATGGDGNLTHTLSPALPAGVTKNASHRISGTPTGHQTATTYTWKVTDADGDAAQLTFTIAIAEDLAPSFSATIANQTWTQNQAITAFTLPLATGGDGNLTHTLTPALPAGVTKNASHRISGTPTGHQTATTYTWKVTDADGDAAELTFTIAIAEDLAPSFSATIPNQTWTQNQAITALTLPTATGGDGNLTHTLTPALPAGVSKDSNHRISGTPSGHQTATTYTWKVTDADGDAAELTFTIAIAEDLSPSFSATIANQTWTQNQAITAFTLPLATGGDGNLTHTLSPALPAGVTKNASHRISGTPTGHQTAATYTWKVTDTDGDAAELTFTITIAEDLSPSFSATIPNQAWTQNKPITAFTLPLASGGDGNLTHTLTPALPAGVTKNASHRISGTPTGHQTAATYTWKVTDADGDAAQLTFTITIAEDLAPSFSAAIPNQTWTQRQAITAFTLPLATGGDGNLTHTLTPALPAGVTKNASHRISGTPSGHQTAAAYTWKVTDTDGDAAELTFTITIAEDLAPSFSATIPNQTWTQNQAITAFTLPLATGGDGNLTHTLTPALPAGVTKNASHRVTGTPTGYQTATTYTWKVTDADGDAAQLTFTITIAEDLAPSFGSQTISDKSWTQRQAITAFTLPTASGGDGSLTYTLSPSLPNGVTKNASHRVSGTPSVKQASTEYTWTAEDADGDTASLTFDIAVDGIPSFGSATISDKSWTQRQAITAFTLPTAAGGDGSLTYTLSPALPAGVTKNASHRISGTPSVKQASTEYTWTAEDSDGDTASLTFDIAVDGVPTFGSQTISNKTWTQNEAITALTLPTATGGDGSLTYTLTPALPAGVSTTTPYAVSGTPTGHQSAAAYTWKATDADGDTAQLTFTITISSDLAPTFSQTIPNQTWTQRQAITAFTLPTAAGGDGSLTYTLSPALPAGVTKNASHRISGTPSVKQASTEYTWTAEDSDGDTASLTFDIAVDGVPTFGSQTISNKTWTQNEAITALTLPTATGGDGSLTYTLTPALPAGVSTTTPYAVSGTPTGHQSAAAYTWKATDADGDTAQLTFTITISSDLAPTFSQTIPNQTWTQRQAITAFTLPTASGGDGSLTYTLSPSLPAGVTKNASHEISGTPTGHQTATTYTWKAADADGDEAEITFTITIAEDLSPSFSATIPNQTWTQRQAITAFTLPLATGGDGSLTHTLTPALPAGVTKNASHEISGTPTGHQTATTYTWKVTDTDGDAAQLTFSIAIAEDLSPSFGSATISDKSWTQRQAITAFTLPTATGGDGNLTYTLSPALPNGVTKNASHRISGTPSVKQASTEYTWTAEDSDGDNGKPDLRHSGRRRTDLRLDGHVRQVLDSASGDKFVHPAPGHRRRR